MEIEEIQDLIRENRDIIKPYYSGNNFEVADEEPEVFITTKYKRDNKKVREKIRKLFKARDVMYVEEMEPRCKECGTSHPPFWSISW